MNCIALYCQTMQIGVEIIRVTLKDVRFIRQMVAKSSLPIKLHIGLPPRLPKINAIYGRNKYQS